MGSVFESVLLDFQSVKTFISSAVHQDDGVRASLHLHHLFPEADGGGEREKQRPMPRVARIGSPRVMCCN